MRANPFGDVKSVKKPSGAFIVDGRHVADTKQCCHCGAHFVMVKGSKIVRGYCLRCDDITCGSFTCDACVPIEKQLELIEKNSLKSGILLAR